MSEQRKFKVGDKVMVKRTSGDWSVGFVHRTTPGAYVIKVYRPSDSGPWGYKFMPIDDEMVFIKPYIKNNRQT